MNFKKFLCTCVVGASALLGSVEASAQNTPAARSEYDQLHTNCGASCSTLSPRSNDVSCLDWTSLAGGLSAAATAQAASCSNLSRDAVTALDHAAATCGTLTGHAAQLAQDLATCRRPHPVAPTQPPSIHLPVCLSGPEFGGALLVCETRSGERLEGEACVRARRSTLARATCACAPGSRAVRLANGRGAFCAAVGPHGEVARPAGVIAVGEGNLSGSVAALQEQMRVLTGHVNDICRHADPRDSEMAAEGETPTSHEPSLDCAEMNRLIVEFMNASRSGGPMTESRVVEIVNHEVAPLRQEMHALRVDVDRLGRDRRSVGVRFLMGVEGGTGAYDGLHPTYFLLGAQLRGRITPGFHLYMEAGVLAGSYGAAQIGNITGYLLGGGIGFEFPAGPTRMSIDLGFGMRTYTDTGIHTAVDADAVGVFGDYRGRVYGGQAAMSVLLWRGLGLGGTLFIGTGDAVVGTDVTGNFAGVGGATSVMGSGRLFWEF